MFGFFKVKPLLLLGLLLFPSILLAHDVSSGDPAFASANIYNNLGYNPFNVPNDQIVGTDGQLNPNASVIYQSLDWYDLLARTGVRQNYNVNVSGGGDDHKRPTVFLSLITSLTLWIWEVLQQEKVSKGISQG